MSRLMTLDELLASPDAILEIRDEDGLEWMPVHIPFTTWDKKGNIWFWRGKEDGQICMNMNSYGKTWRCWRYDDIIREMETTPWEPGQS